MALAGITSDFNVLFGSWPGSPTYLQDSASTGRSKSACGFEKESDGHYAVSTTADKNGNGMLEWLRASRKGLEIPAEEKRPGLDGAPEDADDVGG
ncbi:hypothetical protein VCV18_002304 [Metarhizium anisopliae]